MDVATPTTRPGRSQARLRKLGITQTGKVHALKYGGLIFTQIRHTPSL